MVQATLLPPICACLRSLTDRVLVFGTGGGGSIPLEGAASLCVLRKRTVFSVNAMNWYIYIVECSDKSLYTGISPNPKHREDKHNLKLGAKSLRGKLPVKLVYQELYNNQSDAARRERQIKSWHRKYKLKLIKKGKSDTNS